MQSYTLSDVLALVGISRSVVNAMLTAGVVTPGRDRGNAYRFSFQDLLLFRTAHSLRAANVPTRRVVRSLKKLESLEAGRPLTGVRITAHGGTVAARDAHGQWQVETGQRIIDFDARERPSRVVTIGAPTTRTPATAMDGYTLFEMAQELERAGSDEAAAVYRQAIAAEPGLVDAYVNLGYMMCERAAFDEAIALYRTALEQGADAPLIRFNLAVALEDSGDAVAALAEYHACIALAPDFADAHYNAARLHEALGDSQRAIRHYHQYRRLEPGR